MLRTPKTVLTLLAAGCLGCSDRPAPAPGTAGVAAGVLVVAIDGLRADHLSSLGYDRPTTPHLDALAAEGVLFTQAFAAAPLLVPSHASLVTGCDPIVARRFAPYDLQDQVAGSWMIPARAPHLAVEFLAAGYRTAAFIDDPLLDERRGFGPGFQDYQVFDPHLALSEGSTGRIVRRLLQWLRSIERDRPWFALVHLSDLERSWVQPDWNWWDYFKARPEMDEVPPVGNTDAVFFSIPYSRWRGGVRTIGQYEAAYDGHLRRLDGEIGQLLAGLRLSGRLAETTIAVVGTHGIQFGEAGLYLRAGRYSMADLHVPLIVRGRASLDPERGRRVDDLASLLDLAPTLLDLERLAVPGEMHGLSQAAWVVGPAPSEPLRRQVFASSGLQEGGVAIDERHCLESLAGGRTYDSSLARSWSGLAAGEPDEPRIRFYDRLETPFPPLDTSALLRDPRGQELRRAQREWLAKVSKARLSLQGIALVPRRKEGP